MTKLRLGTSSYSYWHFTPEVTPLEDVFEAAAQLGLAGVEILHQQMASEENGYLQSLKRRAFQLGLDIYNFGIDQDFVWAEGEERQREIAHTLRCIDLAHEMGIPSIRINSGSFRKRGPFSELIAAGGGVEPW
ncbi:MAG TPA: TIM barrel protein, partial [Caldilinea sp.]|nr:TIM barrel protein [Caldilinea sp.]